MGVKVLLGSDEPDSTKWHCNNLNSMFGNWMALLPLAAVLEARRRAWLPAYGSDGIRALGATW